MNKSKNISFTLFKLNSFSFTNTTRIICKESNNNVYIHSFVVYKQYSVYLSKKLKKSDKNKMKSNNTKKVCIKDNENTIRNEMKKNKNITVSELSKITNIPEHQIRTKFYMKLRREISGRVLK